MFTLRCTQKLLARMKSMALAPTPPPATTVLGDWYANLIHTRHGQFVLAMSEKTFLPVVVPAKEARTLMMRIPEALRHSLLALGLPRERVEAEVTAMSHACIAKTANRRVIGTMNEFVFMAQVYADQEPGFDTHALAMWLADTPCSALPLVFPNEATLAAFASGLH